MTETNASRVVASIDDHYRRGNPTLTKIQLDQHTASNTCTECQERIAKATKLREIVGATR